jgi:DeoR/GlpR family transcriptional regulator of sugar metabolism
MKKGRFSEEQIIGVLKKHEAGRKVPELAREIGVSEATIYSTAKKRGSLTRCTHCAGETAMLNALFSSATFRPNN